MREKTNEAASVKQNIAEQCSKNAFAGSDQHPEQAALKTKLTLEIRRLIKRRGMMQAEVGKVLGVNQPKVSSLLHNRPGYFSVERLMEYLTVLGQDVEITVKPTRKEQGEVSVIGHPAD